MSFARWQGANLSGDSFLAKVPQRVKDSPPKFLDSLTWIDIAQM